MAENSGFLTLLGLIFNCTQHGQGGECLLSAIPKIFKHVLALCNYGHAVLFYKADCMISKMYFKCHIDWVTTLIFDFNVTVEDAAQANQKKKICVTSLPKGGNCSMPANQAHMQWSYAARERGGRGVLGPKLSEDPIKNYYVGR